MPRRPAPPEQSGEREEDRQRKLAALRARLHDDATALRTPADWARCLRIAALLPGEDFANILLISAQRPGATLVRDYQQWAATGRHVRRGEKGIEIFRVPTRPPRKRSQDPDHERGPAWRDADRVAHVWDLSQTTGPPITPPALPPPGQMPAELWDALCWLARREGFAVEHEHGVPDDGTTAWTARHIRLRPELSGDQAVWGLAHQLGHILLHATPGYPPGTTTSGCAGIRKAEADSITWIICARYGAAAGRELPYPASWAGSDPRAQPAAAILAAGHRIITATAQIIHHTDRILHGDEPAPAAAARQQPATPTVHDRTGPHDASLIPDGPAGRTRLVLEAAGKFYARQLASSWAPAYLRARGISDVTAHDWHIGYAPGGWTTLTGHLRHLGHSDEEIQAAGLARPSSRGTLIDLFRDRVMLPIHNENGTLAGFIGRAHPDASPRVPKYLNSPETAGYKKSNLLFGLHQTRSSLAHGATPVIVEGPFDAIAVTLASPGSHAGVAPCDTALTSQQAALLSQAADVEHTGILVAFDDDPAGRKAAIRAHSILRPLTGKLQSVPLSGKDPAEILQTDGPAALRTLLREHRQPLSALVIDSSIDSWGRRLRDLDGPYLAMLSVASLIADLLPAGSATQIRAITKDRELQPADDLRPAGHPELAQIARILPADTAYQVARTASKLGFDCSDVLAEIANAATRNARSPKDRRGIRRDNPDFTPPADLPAEQLASTSFPQPSRTPQGSTRHPVSRPAATVNPRRPTRLPR